jgi:hypothetical protein
MRLALFVFIVGSLGAITGCGASQRHAPVAATNVTSESMASDPSYCPPDEMQVAIKPGEVVAAPAKKSDVAVTSQMKPNRQEKPRGTIHAAN